MNLWTPALQALRALRALRGLVLRVTAETSLYIRRAVTTYLPRELPIFLLRLETSVMLHVRIFSSLPLEDTEFVGGTVLGDYYYVRLIM